MSENETLWSVIFALMLTAVIAALIGYSEGVKSGKAEFPVKQISTPILPLKLGECRVLDSINMYGGKLIKINTTHVQVRAFRVVTMQYEWVRYIPKEELEAYKHVDCPEDFK